MARPDPIPYNDRGAHNAQERVFSNDVPHEIPQNFGHANPQNDDFGAIIVSLIMFVLMIVVAVFLFNFARNKIKQHFSSTKSKTEYSRVFSSRSSGSQRQTIYGYEIEQAPKPKKNKR